MVDNLFFTLVNNKKIRMKDKALTKLPTAGLLVINNNKLLLAFSKNKKAWYLPGGKIDAGETSIQSIQREIKEELNIDLNTDLLKFYCHITAIAYGEENNMLMEQDCFIYEHNEEITPANEIEAVKYFDLQTYQKEPVQVEGVLDVFNKLKLDKLIT